MNKADIFKIIVRMRKELDAIEKYISEEPEEITQPSDEERVLRGTAAQVVQLLNSKLDSDFSTKAEKNIKHIVARLREGRVMSDFELVIDYKKSEWGESEKMRGYLRPETLFGTKFEGYLNAARADSRKNSAKSYDVFDIEAEILGRLGA